MYSKGMLAQLWYNQGGDPTRGNLAASIALAESGGDPRSVGIPTSAGRALGLWQIMWPLHQPSYPDRDPFDPNDNAYMATRISSNGANWQPWEAYTNGAYRQFLDDPMGGIDPAGRALSAVGKFAGELASKGIGWALGKVKALMPDLGMLPRWLEGVGSFLKDRSLDWAKAKLTGFLGSSGGGSTRGILNGKTLQLPTTFSSDHETAGLAGYPAVDVFAPPGTTVLSPADGTISRLSGGLDTYTGPGGPYGYSIYLASKLGEYYMTHFGSRAVSEGQHVRYGQPIGTVGDYPNADSDHIHEGLRRFAKGGIFGGGASIEAPFVGSYKIGGVAPRDGLAYVHQGRRSCHVTNSRWSTRCALRSSRPSSWRTCRSAARRSRSASGSS